MIIDVSIKNRIASLTEDAEIVCGNADYVINFDFNDELSEAEEKTARFIFDSEVIDLKFTGNSCRAPIVSNSRELIVGVFTESYASTYIRIGCRFSALCEDVTGIDAEPSLFPNYEKEIAELKELTYAHEWFEDVFILGKTQVTFFKNQSVFKTIPLFNFSGVTNFTSAFSSCTSLESIPLIDTSNGTAFASMFNGCTNLESIPLIDTSNGTTFASMFYGCTNLESIPLIDTSNGTTFATMFCNCTSLKNIPLIDTSNGTVFTSMFYNCTSLENIPLIDTSNGTAFSEMFNGCTNLKSIPLIDCSNTTSITKMFYDCKNLETAVLSCGDKLTNASYVFYGCSKLKSASLGDTATVTNFGRAFYNCTELKTITALNLSAATTVSYMFNNCSALETVGVEGSINKTIDFKYSTKLTVETAKNIIKALTNYAGTSNANKNTIYFASEVWELLNAEGNTAPDGGTWKDYTVSLGWNV